MSLAKEETEEDKIDLESFWKFEEDMPDNSVKPAVRDGKWFGRLIAGSISLDLIIDDNDHGF